MGACAGAWVHAQGEGRMRMGAQPPTFLRRSLRRGGCMWSWQGAQSGLSMPLHVTACNGQHGAMKAWGNECMGQ